MPMLDLDTVSLSSGFFVHNRAILFEFVATNDLIIAPETTGVENTYLTLTV